MQLITILGLAAAVASAKPTVYFIRHGEKPTDDGDGLSAQGMQRAQCLRNVFGASSGYDIGYILAQTPKSSTFQIPCPGKLCPRSFVSFHRGGDGGTRGILKTNNAQPPRRQASASSGHGQASGCGSRPQRRHVVRPRRPQVRQEGCQELPWRRQHSHLVRFFSSPSFPTLASGEDNAG